MEKVENHRKISQKVEKAENWKFEKLRFRESRKVEKLENWKVGKASKLEIHKTIAGSQPWAFSDFQHVRLYCNRS